MITNMLTGTGHMEFVKHYPWKVFLIATMRLIFVNAMLILVGNVVIVTFSFIYFFHSTNALFFWRMLLDEVTTKVDLITLFMMMRLLALF